VSCTDPLEVLLASPARRRHLDCLALHRDPAALAAIRGRRVGLGREGPELGNVGSGVAEEDVVGGGKPGLGGEAADLEIAMKAAEPGAACAGEEASGEGGLAGGRAEDCGRALLLGREGRERGRERIG